MGFGSFLRGVALNMGRINDYNQQHDLVQADIDLKKQAVETDKAKTESAQSLAEARKKISQQISAASASDQQTVADPKKQADIWGNAEQQFTLAGDNESAIRAGKLHDGYLKESTDAATAAVKSKQDAQEELSAAAFNFRAIPTADNANAISRAAVKAGVNPLDIPPPGTPKFATWATTQQQASMSGKERYAAVEKEREFAINKALEADRTRRQDSDRDESRALRAQIQSGMLEARRDKADEKRSHTDFLETEKLNSTLQSAAKPILEDRQRITDVKGLLAVNSPQGDQQVRQALTSLTGHFKGRATNLFYQDNKNFGDVVQRVSGWASHAFTGRYDEQTRHELGMMLDQMEKTVVDPALTALESKQRTKARKYGLDPEQVSIQGDFSRNLPKAGGPAPERRVMKDGTILQKNPDGTIVKVSK